MTNQVAAPNNGVIEALVLNGDLSKMDNQQKVMYYKHICDSLGLNPLTQPFKILKLQGKETMYATKDATDQLRHRDGISVISIVAERIEEIYVVTASVQNKDGRKDSDVGAVNIAGLRGDNLANAFMKATTKAKRRATMSICGLGMLDESEIETVDANAQVQEFPVEQKKKLTDVGFQKAIERIKAGETSVIQRLRDEFILNDQQIAVLVEMEDKNTVVA
jgi:hypothetical protein